MPAALKYKLGSIFNGFNLLGISQNTALASNIGDSDARLSQTLRPISYRTEDLAWYGIKGGVAAISNYF